MLFCTINGAIEVDPALITWLLDTALVGQQILIEDRGEREGLECSSN